MLGAGERTVNKANNTFIFTECKARASLNISYVPIIFNSTEPQGLLNGMVVIPQYTISGSVRTRLDDVHGSIL